MNFDDAAISHIVWKDTLVEYLIKRDGNLKPSEVEVDDKCPLGQWILGEGKHCSNFPEYATLKEQHTRFHKAAGEVVRGALLGLAIKPETVLGAESEFGGASIAVVTAIMDLKRRVPQGAPAAAASAGKAASGCAIVLPKDGDEQQPAVLDWDPSYSVGVSQFDEHHQYLFCLINILLGALGKGHERSALGIVLAELAKYAEKHFTAEEELMAKTNYPRLLEHRQEHARFVARVWDLKKQFDVNSLADASTVLIFLRAWVAHHIKRVDKMYSSHLNASGIH